MRKIVLVPCQFEPKSLMPSLRKRLEELLQIPVHIENMYCQPELFFDAQRSQYNALQILQSLPEIESQKTLICTAVDLYIPIFTFVFGLARLNGCRGIISSHRLSPRYYGLPNDAEILLKRLIKEAVHELGHLAGLKHCRQFDCVMANSATADEVDIKSEFFCPECHSRFLRHFDT